MKNYVSSFLSRLALPELMSLILFAPAIARADTIAINVDFGGGLTGTGSFNTDGTCDICFAGVDLTNFVFTVDDDTFTEADAEAGRLLSRAAYPFGELQGGDATGDTVTFDLSITPNGPIDTVTFTDTDDTTGSHSATATISLMPEPSSLMLLTGGVLVLGLKRRFRKKSAIH